MKNLRKVLALVLAVVMAVSTFTVAFAAEEKTDGEILKALGLVVGNENGDLMEGETIDRASAAALLIRVMNWDKEPVTAYTFADSTWAKAEAATLEKKGITRGVGDNKFGGAIKMDALQVYAWVYAALTGDTASAWDTPELLTKILDADQVAAVVASKGDDAKRSEIFKGMITILTTEVEGKTQLDRLIEDGVVTEAKAIELGLKEAPVTTNAIVSAELLNYKELKVVFTKEASDDVADYTVKTLVGEFAVGVSDVVLSDDKKVATLILTHSVVGGEIVAPVAPQTWLKVEYDDGQLEDSATVAGIIDSKIPAVVGVDTTNKDKITLTFDEAIKSKPTVKVNDGRVYAAVSHVAGSREVELTILNAVAGTTYKLEVSLAKDFANLYMAPQTLNHTYEVESSPVTVSVKTQLSHKIVLELNRPTVKRGTLPAANFTYILNKPVVSATVTDNGKTITLVLFDDSNDPAVGYAAPKGNWDLKISKADEMFIDSWGNKPASASLTVPFTIVIDETAPTVKSIKLDQDNSALYVTFDETVLGGDLISNYEVRNAKDEVVSGVLSEPAYVADTNDKEVKLTVNNAKFETGTYTLVVKKTITDESRNPMTADAKIPFDAKYKQPLTIKVEAINKGSNKVDKIYVTYSSDMPVSALELSKWVLTNGTTAVKVKNIAFDEGSAKVIVITTEEFIKTTLNIYTAAIVDALGNRIADKVFSTTLPNVDFADSTNVAVSAKAISTKKVEIEIAGRVNTSSIDRTNILIDNVAVQAGILVAENNGKTIITLQLDNELAANTTQQLKISGIKLTSGLEVSRTTPIVDKIKPELKAATATLTTATATGTATIVMDFSENLATKTMTNVLSYFASELVLTYEEKALTAGSEYTVEVSGNRITINVSKVVADEADITVKLAADSKYVSDRAVDADGNSNALLAFEETLKITN